MYKPYLSLGFAVLAEEALLRAGVWVSSGPEQQTYVLTPLGSHAFPFQHKQARWLSSIGIKELLLLLRGKGTAITGARSGCQGS